MNKDLIISAIKTKLRKQAGALGFMRRNPSIPLSMGYSVLTTAGDTPQGSRPSYYATDYAANVGRNLLWMNDKIPVPAKVAAMVVDPIGMIPALNRKDPLAPPPIPYGMPEHEK